MSETKPEIKKMYFQLLIGSHFDATKGVNGKKYVAGDIIITERDLTRQFGSDKFRRLSPKEIAAMQTDKPATQTCHY